MCSWFCMLFTKITDISSVEMHLKQRLLPGFIQSALSKLAHALCVHKSFVQLLCTQSACASLLNADWIKPGRRRCFKCISTDEMSVILVNNIQNQEHILYPVFAGLSKNHNFYLTK